jgi:hypothetical protein
MRKINFVGISVVLAVTFFLIIPNQSFGNEHYRYKDRSVWADFWYESGTVYGSIIVTAADYMEKVGPGQPDKSQRCYVSVWLSDWSTGDDVMDMSGSFPIEEEGFLWTQDYASLNVVVSVYDWISDTMKDVNINLEWIGEDEVMKGNSFSHSRFYKRRWNGSDRVAQLNGTVIIDGVDYVMWPWATIEKVNWGDLYIIK